MDIVKIVGGGRSTIPVPVGENVICTTPTRDAIP